MAFVINDRVKETSTSTGTGAITLDGAVDKFESFAAGIGGSNETYYTIVHQTENEFEVGRAILNSDASQITSRTIYSSSNSDSAVDFSAGTKDVFCTYPATRAPSPSMSATTYVTTHNSTLSDDQTMDSGVLAGPVDITGTLNITGKLIILN